MTSIPDPTLTPQATLARALELRQRRRAAYNAWSVDVVRCWEDASATNYEQKAQSEREWLAAVEDFRQFLISVGASNLDELMYRAKEAT